MEDDDNVPRRVPRDKFQSHMSHNLSYADQKHTYPPFYRWRLPPFNPKMVSFFGTGKRRRTDAALQTPPYGLREELYNHWSQRKSLDVSRRLSFYNICNSYRDVLYPTRSGKSSLVDSYLIHLLNHSLKSIDQGFTRPKVLILVPLARDAHLLVWRLLQLYPSANMAGAEGFEKFNTRIVKHTENDDFIFSIKLERESIRLYCPFYNSDILVASPLGLVTKIWLGEKTNKRDVDDYLSSIDLLVVDYSRRKDFKNWAYVTKIVEYLNSMPAMDATHIRPLRRWHLDGEARFYRQTIILSHSVNEDIKDLFYRHCMNFEGKMEFSHLFSICRRFPSLPHPLPLGHCIIALTYPPGNKLKSCIERSAVQNFFIPEGFPRDFAVHGAWQISKSNVKDLTGAEVQVSSDWKRLLGLCMPNVLPRIAIKNMTDELRRHGQYIDFLNQHNYVQFVVGVFLRYRFDELMSFLCKRIRIVLEPKDISTIRYLRKDWIGISVNHLTEILRQYDPIYGADLITKVFHHEGRFFFYELCTCVTKDGKLAQRNGEAVRGIIFIAGQNRPVQVEVPAHDIVYFLEV